MIKNNKKAPVVDEQELNIDFPIILSPYQQLIKQAKEIVYFTCKYGTLKDLIKLRTEIAEEMTCNKFYLKRIDDAIEKAVRGDFLL